MSREEMSIVKSLKRDKSIIIVPADKGCATVLLDRQKYDEKLLHLLSDETTYTKLKRDPAPSLERKMNALLLQLQKEGQLPRVLYLRLRSSAGQTPRLYGLPKIHKPDTPLRPIVSFISSPTYHLSQYLARVLSPLVGNTSTTVRNSQDFVEFISSQKLEDGEVLVSFDVVSLFTKVPTDLAVTVARERLLNDSTLLDRTTLSVENIVTLLRFCLSATFLTFRGSYYKQIFGTAMGSPVSVVVANLVMEDIEQRALSSFHLPPRFWKRYVDDTCVVLPACEVEGFHHHLNCIETSIQFTVEFERDGTLPFLDVLLSRDTDGFITTSVYRKPTHTDKYLSFLSHHPTSHKASVVRTLFHRARTIPSTGEERRKEELRIKKALYKNGYSRKFIHRFSEQAPTRTLNQPKATVVIPYIRGISESIRRMLSSYDIRVCMKPHCTLRQIFVHPKDPIPMDQRSGVVYEIPCDDCEQVYVGQTDRSFACRLKEHRRAFKSIDDMRSAVAEHAFNSGHAINWDNARVIDTCHHYYTRIFLESWYISSKRHAMNKDRGPLSSVYKTLHMQLD